MADGNNVEQCGRNREACESREQDDDCGVANERSIAPQLGYYSLFFHHDQTLLR
jgi:hypothetical protein